jgi:hypothetical protein
MKMEQTECSKTLAFNLQMPGNNQEEAYDMALIICKTDISVLHLISNILVFSCFYACSC